jgi:hypothetical protein
MGKVVSLLAACILLASAIPGLAPRVAVAQTLTLPCSVTAPSPMQGQYTGPWHSDGDYHFSAYNTDIELKITIDGTLSLTVSPDGHVSGTATGSVQAPIYDYGRLDVSSGYGTISGPVSGMLTASGPALTLSAPVILMHWGTFVGGGYTVDQNITMPDYTLSVGNSQCISASGSIAETDFPPKWLVADGTGQPPVLAPGRGTATGTWNVTSSDADLYNQLSQQVDGFISSANGVLAGNPSYATAQTQIIQPLQTLVATIEAHPTVARCLLERLGTWAVSASASLYGTASTTVSAIPAAVVGALPDVRSATDTIRLADTLGVSCHVSDGGVSDRLTAALTGALQGWAATGDAVNTADLAREFLLWKGAAGEPAAQTAINSGIHGQHPPADASSLLAALRNAYVFGDDADASILYERIAAAPHALSAQAKSSSGKKKKRKPKPKPTARPTPRPKPTARPAPTATATPKTLEQVLTSGITTISGNASAGTVPTFSWQAVKTTSGSPVQYVVTVTGASGVVWTWAGTTTSATFGDTTQADLPGSAADGWTAPLPSGYHWSVLALAGDRVVGLKLR